MMSEDLEASSVWCKPDATPQTEMGWEMMEWLSRTWSGRQEAIPAIRWPRLASPPKRNAFLPHSFLQNDARYLLEIYQIQTLVRRYLPCLLARNGGLRLLSVPSLQNFAVVLPPSFKSIPIVPVFHCP